MKFAAYSTMAIPQARFALAISYSFTNEDAIRAHHAGATGSAAECA